MACIAAIISTSVLAFPGVVFADETDDLNQIPTMRDYQVDQFSAEAASLDPLFNEALSRDLGISGSQYLLEGAAAADASYVLEGLSESGFEMLGSKIDGTTLTIYVDPDGVNPEAVREAVIAAGAQVEFGSPEPENFDASNLISFADLYNGQGYSYVSGSTRYFCSVGFTGKSVLTGANQFITAGHCGPSAPVVGQFTSLNPSAAGSANYQIPSALGSLIGLPVGNTFAYGNGADLGIVGIPAAGISPKSSVLSYGYGAGAPLASAPIPVRDARSAVVGSSLCKSGVTTGWTCGTVLAVDYPIEVGPPGNSSRVNSIVTNACSDRGDSGGAAIVGSVAVGITSAGSNIGCGDPRFISTYFPMVSTSGSTSVSSLQGSSWEPSVFVSAPTVSSPSAAGSVIQNGTMTGNLPGSVQSNRVRVTISDDLQSPRLATLLSDGRWSLDLSGVSLGNHTYSVIGTWNAHSRSVPSSGSFRVVNRPVVNRIDGPDRYEVAVKVSQNAYPGTAIKVPVVYVVTGQNYPDALSAAPAAVKQGGPLLLTMTSMLPQAVISEIKRLSPAKIVVVGGSNSVSSSVYDQLGALAPAIQRIGGADRYATSRAVVDAAFTTSNTVYVATGQNFPDALSASAAAGAIGAPVLLLNGGAGEVDSSTLSVLSGLGASRVKIAGGSNTVSTTIESGLQRIAATIRVSGNDRYATAIAINRDAFLVAGAPTPKAVYLATGLNFPDALAGAVLAGKTKSPVYLVQPTCLPIDVLADIATVQKPVTLLGGTTALAPSNATLTPCPQ